MDEFKFYHADDQETKRLSPFGSQKRSQGILVMELMLFESSPFSQNKRDTDADVRASGKGDD